LRLYGGPAALAGAGTLTPSPIPWAPESTRGGFRSFASQNTPDIFARLPLALVAEHGTVRWRAVPSGRNGIVALNPPLLFAATFTDVRQGRRARRIPRSPVALPGSRVARCRVSPGTQAGHVPVATRNAGSLNRTSIALCRHVRRAIRSEERRVGEEGRSGRLPYE